MGSGSETGVIDIMNDKDRFDAFIRLADFRTHRWDARRSFESRVSIALWALLAAATAYMKTRPEPALLAVFLVVVVAGHALLFVLPIWVSNKLDIETAFYYAEMAEGLLTPCTHVRNRPMPPEGLQKWIGAANDWGVRFEVIATALLAFGVYVFGGHFSN